MVLVLEVGGKQSNYILLASDALDKIAARWQRWRRCHKSRYFDPVRPDFFGVIIMSQSQRPEFFALQNGAKATLPFSATEYENRLGGLRQLMASSGVDAMLLTSMHNIAYYSGFLYCSFGRPYACVVTADRCVTISANIDLGQPWRRCYGDNVIYTDWKRNNYWRAIKSI